VARLAEVAEALGHAGGQVCLVEVGEPRRVVFAGGSVEGLLCPGEGGAAGVRVVARGVPVGFHDQALGEQGRRPVADGCGLGSPGEVDRLIRPGQVEGLVRLGGEDLRGEGVVVGVPRVGQRLGEVPLGQSVLVAVVGDPAGFFCFDAVSLFSFS
jgi:hypothetical protein